MIVSLIRKIGEHEHLHFIISWKCKYSPFCRLKLRILQDATRLNFRETNTAHRTKLEGYVAADDQIYPFEQITENHAENQANDTEALWNTIKMASSHIDEWQQLFVSSVSEEN